MNFLTFESKFEKNFCVQVLPISNVTKNIPERKGSLAENELVFQVTLPPLGFSTFFIKMSQRTYFGHSVSFLYTCTCLSLMWGSDFESNIVCLFLESIKKQRSLVGQIDKADISIKNQVLYVSITGILNCKIMKWVHLFLNV